ncbi:MAG: transcriptional regulator NrdR [Candidatus Omnitrophota bacterium]|nr:transcriptional regulator NrdR [Candidatus Omnitrophota bacterium]
MKCPYCKHEDDKVVDSRSSGEGYVIRRRRECLKCGYRFTTYERIEQTPLMVIKKDGRKEEFNRHKLLNGVKKACEKRPVAMEILEKAVDEIERKLEEKFEDEIASNAIGRMVMRKLYSLDEVAYVRFASVYRQFKDVDQFMDEVKKLRK